MPTLAERLAARLVADPETGCHNWTGTKNLRGYGRIKHGRRTLVTHRVAYELAAGAIPDGLVIDHLCRNPSCCNPAHLEPVHPRENVRRGRSGHAERAKTHCPQGHAYDAENTFIRGNGHRVCRTCTRAAARRRYRLSVAAHDEPIPPPEAGVA